MTSVQSSRRHLRSTLAEKESASPCGTWTPARMTEMIRRTTLRSSLPAPSWFCLISSFPLHSLSSILGPNTNIKFTSTCVSVERGMWYQGQTLQRDQVILPSVTLRPGSGHQSPSQTMLNSNQATQKRSRKGLDMASS